MSRILIVGSKRFSESPTGPELKRFERVAKELGAVLAERGHEIVVCSTSEDTADWCVVNGANESSTPESKARVSLFMSHRDLETRAGKQPFAAASFPNIDCKHRLTGGWFSTYDAAAKYSDAVITLGGSARGTGAALYTALARSKPVVAIPTFGGAAQDIWRDTATHYDLLPVETRVALESTDGPTVVRAAVDAAEHFIKNNPFPRKSPAFVYTFMPIAMLGFAAAWVWLSHVWEEEPGWKPYAIAGLMSIPGMVLRYIQDSRRNEEAYFGVAKVMKDAARVLGLLLLAFLILDFTIVHTGGGDVEKSVLQAKTLALVGFAVGLIVEDMSDLLTNTLRSVARTAVEGKK